MNFYETRMGREFLERQVPELTNAIKALTAALHRPSQTTVLPVTAEPNFLQNLYFGHYEPSVFKPSPTVRDLSRNVTCARNTLSAALSESDQVKLSAYEDALAARDSVVTEQAYESGFCTAVQMIVAGLSQPAATENVERGMGYEPL